LSDTASIRARRIGDHRSEFALSQGEPIECEVAESRHGLARYGHDNNFARSEQLHRHNRTPTRAKDRVPRRGGPSSWIYHRVATRNYHRSTAEGRVSRLFTNGL